MTGACGNCARDLECRRCLLTTAGQPPPAPWSHENDAVWLLQHTPPMDGSNRQLCGSESGSVRRRAAATSRGCGNRTSDGKPACPAAAHALAIERRTRPLSQPNQQDVSAAQLLEQPAGLRVPSGQRAAHAGFCASWPRQLPRNVAAAANFRPSGEPAQCSSAKSSGAGNAEAFAHQQQTKTTTVCCLSYLALCSGGSLLCGQCRLLAGTPRQSELLSRTTQTCQRQCCHWHLRHQRQYQIRLSQKQPLTDHHHWTPAAPPHHWTRP